MPAAVLETPLREQIVTAELCRHFPAILSLAAKHGPETLAEQARASLAAGQSAWEEVLEGVLSGAGSELPASQHFFARACLQPLAENLQLQMPQQENYSDSLCPACGGLPQVAVLRPEGEGASRWLQCSFCLREWLFRRLICPWCKEENKEKLPRYSAEQYSHVHVEACETCKRYLKAVDLTLDGHAEPLVDEAALAVLDVWAAERSFTKIIPNLLGF